MSSASRIPRLRTDRSFPHSITILAATTLILATLLLIRLDNSDLIVNTYTAHISTVVEQYVEKGKGIVGLGACAGWNPSDSEERDPPRCRRARQYRQVQSVLEREIRGEHEHWYFTREPNIATLKKLAKCFLPSSHPDYTPCPDRPLVINGYWFSAITIHNATVGETIWQESILKEMDSFGIMSIFVGAYDNWIEVAEMMPDVYRFIWGSDSDIVACFTDPRCVATEHYTPPEETEDLSVGVPEEEKGVIPIWRLQIADYWGSRPLEISGGGEYWGVKRKGEWSLHSLGTQWIQTPWPLPNHVHLPYSIEEYCLRGPEKPYGEREDTVLVLAKNSNYFHDAYATPIDSWAKLAQEPNFTLLSTAAVVEGNPMPEGLKTIGQQMREAYEGIISSSKVLLGMGLPSMSPSVYTALCQGTPVVLPYHQQEFQLSKGGWELFSTEYQHPPAMAIGAPYVYSYQKNNFTQMLDMINQALITPIDRYIPEDMRLPYVRSQLLSFLERDLYGMFRKVLHENGGKVPSLMAGLRERCGEQHRCPEPLAAGRRPSTPQRWREVMSA